MLLEAHSKHDAMRHRAVAEHIYRRHPELFSNPTRHGVVRMHDRDETGRTKRVACVIAASSRGLARVAAALQRHPHVIADLKLQDTIHGLQGQSTVTDELAIERLDNLQPVPKLHVPSAVSRDPFRGLGA